MSSLKEAYLEASDLDNYIDDEAYLKKYSGISLESIDAKSIERYLEQKRVKMLVGSLLSRDKFVDINNKDSCIKYLELLRIYRREVTDDLDNAFKKLRRQLTSVFASDTPDSFYEPNRYFLELIQNANDAIAANDVENANDAIEANETNETKAGWVSFSFAPDKIKLEYIGKKFNAKDVFSITNLFETGKDGEDGEDDVIGEKGIGFKTVFGIAGKATIRSGNFWFSISSENTLLPEPAYEKFVYDKNKVTIILEDLEFPRDIKNAEKQTYKDKPGHCWYERLKSDYITKKDLRPENGLLNKNPILFLNKVNDLSVSKVECSDETKIKKVTEYFSFHVKETEKTQEIKTEQDGVQVITVSVKLIKNNEVPQESSVECLRYSEDKIYDKELLKKRFDREYTDGKSYRFIAVIPRPRGEGAIFEGVKRGVLYSYFPTKIETTVPLFLHAPYKLTLNRGGIDPGDTKNDANEKTWYSQTNVYLREFMLNAYEKFAGRIKEDIVLLIPKQGMFEKTDYLKDFSEIRNVLLKKNIFWAEDRQGKGKLCTLQDVIWIKWPSRYTRNLKDEKRIFEMWKTSVGGNSEKILFQYPPDFAVPNYEGINIKNLYDDLVQTLFWYAATESGITVGKIDEILGLISKYITDEVHVRPNNYYKEKKIQRGFIEAIGSNREEIYKIFRNYLIGLRKNQKNIDSSGEADIPVWKEFLKEVDRDDNPILKYIYVISQNTNIIRIDVGGYGDNNVFFLPFKEVFCVSSKGESESFRAFAEEYFKDTPNYLEYYRDAEYSVALDSVDYFYNPKEEFDENRCHEREDEYTEIKNKYYKERREDIKHIIDQFRVTSKPYLFLRELIANADDCKYNCRTAKLNIDLEDKELTLSYNERGFSQEDYNKLCSLYKGSKIRTDVETTGYMGLGFFSVYTWANKVEISSKRPDARGVWHMGYTYKEYIDKEDNKKKSLIQQAERKELENVNEEIQEGTCMHIRLNDDVELFGNENPEDVLYQFLKETCLCLKHLQQINFTLKDSDITISINIKDPEEKSQNIRKITISKNDKTGKPPETIRLEKHDYNLPPKCIKENEETVKRMKLDSPRVIVYLPADPETEVNMSECWRLYSGLPTEEELTVPMIIDAPFYMNLRREKADEHNDEEIDWNKKVRETIRFCIIDVVNERIKGVGLSAYHLLEPLPDTKSKANWFDAEHYKKNLLIPILNGKSIKLGDNDQVCDAPLFVRSLYENEDGIDIINECLNELGIAGIIDQTYGENEGEEDDLLKSVFGDKFSIDSEEEYRLTSSVLQKITALDEKKIDNLFKDVDIKSALYEIIHEQKEELRDSVYKKTPVFPVYYGENDIKYESYGKECVYFYYIPEYESGEEGKKQVVELPTSVDRVKILDYSEISQENSDGIVEVMKDIKSEEFKISSYYRKRAELATDKEKFADLLKEISGKAELIGEAIKGRLHYLISKSSPDGILDLWNAYSKEMPVKEWQDEIGDNAVFILINGEASGKNGTYIPGEGLEKLFYENPIEGLTDGLVIVAKDYCYFASEMGVENLSDPKNHAKFVDCYSDYLEAGWKWNKDEVEKVIKNISNENIKKDISYQLLYWLIMEDIPRDDRFENMKQLLNLCKNGFLNEGEEYSDKVFLSAFAVLLHNDFTEDQSTILFTIIPQELKDSLINHDGRLLKFDPPRLQTMYGIKVRSKDEIIIFERLKQLCNEYTIQYECGSCEKKDKCERKDKEGILCGHMPDFHIVTKDGKEYYWEHLGVWEKKSYREDNIEKLGKYLVGCKDHPQLLPRITFPKKYRDENGNEIKLPHYLEVTGSSGKLDDFLNCTEYDLEELYNLVLKLDWDQIIEKKKG